MSGLQGWSDPVARKIVDFLEGIGIPVVAEPLDGEAFLPGVTIRDGTLVADPERVHPGDLLHEAGHIAVTEPELRGSLNAVRDDPGEEMAAIAWSWAAGVKLGLDPVILFHSDGYRGGSEALIENFAAGRDVGVPMLRWFGMTAGWGPTAEPGLEPYPHMERWLR